MSARRIPTLALAALLPTLAAGACATRAQLAADTYAAPREAVRAAEAVGAPENPQAALYLRLAKEQLARANDLVADGDVAEAERMLQRAQADAELALALARQDETREELRDLDRRIQRLDRSIR